MDPWDPTGYGPGDQDGPVQASTQASDRASTPGAAGPPEPPEPGLADPGADPLARWERRTVEVRTLRVFADETGSGGSLFGVVLDAAKLLPEAAERRALASRLPGLMVAFVDDADAARVRVHTSTGELPLAGHPLVGTAWLLGRLLGGHPETLVIGGAQADPPERDRHAADACSGTRPGSDRLGSDRPGSDRPGSERHLSDRHPADRHVASWQEDGRVWIRGPLAATPPWWHERRADLAEVVAATSANPALDLVQVWAWEDAGAGLVRARAFGPRLGIPEVEASGSASMRLAAALGRQITVRHGAKSVLVARPGPPGFADVGGFVVEDETILVEDL